MNVSVHHCVAVFRVFVTRKVWGLTGDYSLMWSMAVLRCQTACRYHRQTARKFVNVIAAAAVFVNTVANSFPVKILVFKLDGPGIFERTLSHGRVRPTIAGNFRRDNGRFLVDSIRYAVRSVPFRFRCAVSERCRQFIR